MTDPTALSLIDAAEAIRARRLSARELTAAAIARAEKLQPALNCFIHMHPEEALADAGRADEAQARGASLGPLHGIPLAHKDMYYRRGRPSTCGSKIRRDFVPDVTATVLRRFDDAGAIDLGGLNMSEFAFGPIGHNVHWGDCRNPWNPEHATGGSSSGSGSAVGARVVFGALGSDTGGSIRLPSANCGIVGIKPTHTRVSRYGVMGLSFSLDTVGPMARTVRDCARLFGVVAGHDPEDITSSAMPVADYEAATVNPSVRGLRIGVPTNYYYDLVTDDARNLLQASLRTYADLGAEVVEVEVPDHREISDLTAVVMAPEAATLHGTWLRERPQDYGAQVRARIEPGLAYPATRYLQALQVRPAIVRRFCEQVFSRCDVLHAPALSFPVPTRAEVDVKDGPDFPQVLGRMTYCTRALNYLGLPGLSVPCGFTGNGLPCGFQLIGRAYAEADLFRAGAAYEAATEWTRRAPPL